MCEVKYTGVSLGSYARQIVKEYIKREDFFENKLIFNEALKKASVAHLGSVPSLSGKYFARRKLPASCFVVFEIALRR